jgi:hypothetical protein
MRDRAVRGPGRIARASVEARLPIELSSGNLCPDAETPVDVERDVRARAEALIIELGRRPNELVTYTYYDAHGPDDEEREITIRELAEEQLADLDSGGDCAPELRRRIRAAMD